MKLVRIGNIILNMDQLLAVKDEGLKMFLFFAGSSEKNIISVKLEDENYKMMHYWLNRIGVNDLSTEDPEFDWLI